MRLSQEFLNWKPIRRSTTAAKRFEKGKRKGKKKNLI